MKYGNATGEEVIKDCRERAENALTSTLNANGIAVSLIEPRNLLFLVDRIAYLETVLKAIRLHADRCADPYAPDGGEEYKTIVKFIDDALRCDE